MGGETEEEPCPLRRDIDIDQPRYDQEVYIGRAKHFFKVTNPLYFFASESTLDRAACFIRTYRCKEKLPECITEDQLWQYKALYDSGFHPETGEKLNRFGRMSAQVPMNMFIIGGMMTFYKSTPAVIFWQWINQSFNALVNYSNRSGNTIGTNQLLASYFLATGGAMATALYLNKIAKRFPPIIGRFVPFVAVAAANCINIPMMRAHELKKGIPVVDEKGKVMGNSRTAAERAIGMTTVSRIIMAAPGMAVAPFVMNHLERRGTLCRYPWINLPVQMTVLGVCLTFATPLCCALFKQRASMRVADLEPELQDKIHRLNYPPKEVYYNKGL